MSAEEKDVAALQRLGLTEYESRIYLTLARMGAVKASEVSFFGHVPRTKTYGAIRELEKKGLINITPGKPEIYAVRAPTEVLMPLVASLEGGVKEAANLVQRLAVTYESNIIVRSQMPREGKEMWIIEGRLNVLNKMNEVFAQASKSINYSTSSNGLIRAYKANSNALEKAKDRGVAVRMLTTMSSDNAALAHEMTGIAEVKNTDKHFQFQNFVSVDSRDLLIADVRPDDLSTDYGSDIAVWNRNKLTLGVHDQLFACVWETLSESTK